MPAVMKTALTFVVVLAAACGGGKSKPAATTEAKQMAPGGMMNMPPELAKFHDVLAPRWHAEKGPKRMADTCSAVGEFQADADAIAKATPPAGGDAAKWGTGAKSLTDAVVALDGTCKANDATAFEPAFEQVHNSFHVHARGRRRPPRGDDARGHDARGHAPRGHGARRPQDVSAGAW